MRRIPTAVLISGRGSNMQALVEAARDPAYPAEIALVLSNEPDAAGLAVARAQGVETAVVDHRAFRRDRAGHEGTIDSAMKAAGAELVALAGYMRVLTPWLVEAWRGRMLNIHPSLLPDLPGLDTHARALAADATVHGCTVHLVTEGVDEGPILGQATLEVSAADTAETLGKRVLELEHRLYPEVLAAYARRIAAGEA